MCDGCTAQPTGIEGHGELFAHRMSGSRMQFKCRSCGALWHRTYTGEGAFEWTHSSGDFLGSEIPGRRAPGP